MILQLQMTVILKMTDWPKWTVKQKAVLTGRKVWMVGQQLEPLEWLERQRLE